MPTFVHCNGCTRTFSTHPDRDGRTEVQGHKPHSFPFKFAVSRLDFMPGGWSPVKARFVRALTK